METVFLLGYIPNISDVFFKTPKAALEYFRDNVINVSDLVKCLSEDGKLILSEIIFDGNAIVDIIDVKTYDLLPGTSKKLAMILNSFILTEKMKTSLQSYYNGKNKKN